MRIPAVLFRLLAAAALILTPVFVLAELKSQASAPAVPAVTCPTVGPGPSYTVTPGPPYTNVNWSGCNLTSANLSGSTLYAYLNNSNFTGANLSNANASGSLAYDSNFTNANLANVYFAAAGIQRANFTGANLTNVNFGASYLEGAILLSANLNGVKSGGITGAPVQMPPGWRFMSGYLLGPQADLSWANLASFDLTGMNLAGATWSGSAALTLDTAPAVNWTPDHRCLRGGGCPQHCSPGYRSGQICP